MRGDYLPVKKISFGLDILGNGIKTTVEMEIPELEFGKVLCLEKKFNGRKFTLVIVNRPEAFRILAIDQLGTVSELYGGSD